MKNRVRLLFIGNSHTFVNSVPLLVRDRAEEAGFDCEVTMIAHGGWYLSQHVKEPDVRFNILKGRYDYVILQEHAHPWGPEDVFWEAARTLTEWIREGNAKAVLYETWAAERQPEMQEVMNRVYREVARETGALVAPVGENWWAYREAHPDLQLYYTDGEHAGFAGSDFAAKIIWETVLEDLNREDRDTL